MYKVGPFRVFTQKSLEKFLKAFEKKITHICDQSTFAAINPVIWDLERLKATLPKDKAKKITSIQKFLLDNFKPED